MKLSRRRFVGALSASALLGQANAIDARENMPRGQLARHILDLFATLPGKRALYLQSPGLGQNFEVAFNPDARLFCGSAFKVFVLLEFLRMVENGEATMNELLAVDASVWSPNSPVLTPWPGAVTGQVNAKTAMDAMISRSDNTATDMLLARVGADRVRQFLASIGSDARIPDSTRRFFGYILGAPDWQSLTWEQILSLLKFDPYALQPVLNDVQTMAATPREFATFYARALQNEFFVAPSTQTALRAVLAQSEAIPRSIPLGVNAFLKGGSIDFNDEFALCLAGGVYLPNGERWVYFGLTINWTAAQAGDLAAMGPPFAAVVNGIFTSLRDRLGPA